MQLYTACLDGDLDAMRAALDSDWIQENIFHRDRAFNEIKFTWLKNTTLHAACLSGNFDIVSMLCALCADANVTNRKLETPLHCAVIGGNVQIVMKLIANNANVNAASIDGSTPLHLVIGKDVEWDNKGALLVLLNAGAKILKDHSDSTPLDLACEAGDLELVRLLLLGKDLLGIEGHVRTLFLMLQRGHLPVAITLLNSIRDVSTRLKLLVSVLQYAPTSNDDVDDLVSNIKFLPEANSRCLPGGLGVLLKEAKDLDRSGIIELIRSHEADDTPLP
ncbi:hypothetical protein ACOMHN_055819 [Nucella lapillus]